MTKSIALENYPQLCEALLSAAGAPIDDLCLSAPWPEIIDLSHAIPSRFNPDWLPAPIGQYVSALSTSLSVSVDMVGVAALSMLGITCQTKTVQFNKWSEPLCLYTLLIAEPGEKKSPVMTSVRKPLLDWQYERNAELAPKILQSRRTKEILEKKLLKCKEKAASKAPGSEVELMELYNEIDSFQEYKEIRLFVDDVTPEKLAAIMAEQGENIALVSSEGGIFQTIAGRYSGGAPNVDLFLKSFNGEPCIVDRMTRQTITMKSPKLSAFLSVQPHVLKEVIGNNAFCGLGLVDRFLYVVPESCLGKSVYRSPRVPQDIEDGYHNTIRRLLDRREISIEYSLSHEADDIFNNYFDEINRRMLGDLNFMQGWAGKHCGIVGRIAAIIEASSSNRIEVSAESMRRAINIGRYLIEHAKAAFDFAGADEVMDKARYILKRLLEKSDSVISQRDILRQCQRKDIKTVADLFDPLLILCERGYLRPTGAHFDGEAHRPESPKYELNPKIIKI